jgi:hypothetical protein
MNPKTIPARNAPRLPVAAKQGQTPGAGFSVDFQDLFSLGMDRAIGIEKASLAAAARMQSDVLDHYKNGYWFSPALGKLFGTATEVFASCMELQMSWFALMASHISSTVASSSGMQARQARLAAEALERGMDIVIGARAK